MLDLLTAPSPKSILCVLKLHGYHEKSLIDKKELTRVLEQQHENALDQKINPELINDLWSEAEANSQGEIVASTMVDIIVEAQKILRSRISQLDGPEGMIQSSLARIAELDQELQDYIRYYSEKQQTISSLRKELIEEESQLVQRRYQLASFEADHRSLCAMFKLEEPAEDPPNTKTTYYTGQSVQQKQSSILLVLLHLTNLLAVLELLICSSLRISMFTLSLYLHSAYLVWLGKYRVYAIKLWLLHCVLTIILDCSFLVLKMSGSQQLMPIQHPSNHPYSIVMMVLLGLTLPLRVVLGFAYSKLQNKKRDVLYYCQIFSNKIYFNEEEEKAWPAGQTKRNTM